MAVIQRAAKPASDAPDEAKKAAQAAAAAPDSKKAPTLVGKRVMINLGFEPEFLAEIDAQCARRGGISRPALIRLALSRLFESGV